MEIKWQKLFTLHLTMLLNEAVILREDTSCRMDAHDRIAKQPE